MICCSIADLGGSFIFSLCDFLFFILEFLFTRCTFIRVQTNAIRWRGNLIFSSLSLSLSLSLPPPSLPPLLSVPSFLSCNSPIASFSCRHTIENTEEFVCGAREVHDEVVYVLTTNRVWIFTTTGLLQKHRQQQEESDSEERGRKRRLFVPPGADW
jgi:hypothetical protein